MKILALQSGAIFIPLIENGADWQLDFQLPSRTCASKYRQRAGVPERTRTGSAFRNLFGKLTKIDQGFLTDGKYYLPVDHGIIMNCDVSEADCLFHGLAGR